MAQATQPHNTIASGNAPYINTAHLRSLAAREDWQTPQGRRKILYFSLRCLTWKATRAWQVSRRWVEDTEMIPILLIATPISGALSIGSLAYWLLLVQPYLP